MGCLMACGNNSAGPAAPSTKRVDSAVSAAPDTIKAIVQDPTGKTAADSIRR